jgi:fused signal recognition particle receptor
VIFIIGVNGVGKTTSVGKLAGILKGQGRKVLIAAADTFRAAAGDQLAEWANRAGVDMIGGNEGADPASVIYDAVNAAKARNVDVLICDTAGRLHNKKNLMEELKKMNRIIDREFPNAHRENLIVLDGTTGQNALSQAREFGEVANLTGVILTKMDGTAKGGIAVAIQSELNVPVKYIGVGETIEDLQKFNADEFVDALFDIKPETIEVDEPEISEPQISDSEDDYTEAVEEPLAEEENIAEDIEQESDAEENTEPEIKFSWGDEEIEEEEQPKKKKWQFWK